MLTEIYNSRHFLKGLDILYNVKNKPACMKGLIFHTFFRNFVNSKSANMKYKNYYIRSLDIV